MLAELAAASAAYTTIKTAISQGKELFDVGKQISEFVHAEEELKARADARKKNPLNKVLGKDASDFEEFLALEKLRQQKDQLRSHMRLYGRSGMYDDWVEFSAKARKQRMEALKQAQKERQEMVEMITIVVVVLVAWGGVGAGIYFWLF